MTDFECTSAPESITLTIHFEDGGDGWIVSSIPAAPGVFSQGRTREEAKFMALDALKCMLETLADDAVEADTEQFTFRANP